MRSLCGGGIRILFPIGQKTLAEAHARRMQTTSSSLDILGAYLARGAHIRATPAVKFVQEPLCFFPPVNVVHKGRVARVFYGVFPSESPRRLPVVGIVDSLESVHITRLEIR